MEGQINKQIAKNEFSHTQTLQTISEKGRYKICKQTRSEIFNLYHVSRQIELTNQEDECFFSDAPTLADLNDIYGDGTSQEWLVYQFCDLSEFCGAREKISIPQIRALVELITSEYKWLKLTEIMLFLRRFKLGCYEKFYGAIDPLVIMRSIKDFLKERNLAWGEREEIIQKNERSSYEKNAITRAEYDKLREIQNRK